MNSIASSASCCHALEVSPVKHRAADFGTSSFMWGVGRAEGEAPAQRWLLHCTLRAFSSS